MNLELNLAHDGPRASVETSSVGDPTLGQFFTPAWAAEAMVRRYFPSLHAGDFVVDAGCGRGVFLNAVPRSVPAMGVEIDPDLAASARQFSGRPVIVGDFSAVDLPARPTVILGNPPFDRNTSDRFVERAAELLEEGGRCGFVLPTTYLSFVRSWRRVSRIFGISTELLPRSIFPRISVSLSFYLFTKTAGLKCFSGLALFDEASEVMTAPVCIRSILTTGSSRRGVWHGAVRVALELLNGNATLSQIYAVIDGRQPRPISTWRDTVRRVLQEGEFERVGHGRWALRIESALEPA